MRYTAILFCLFLLMHSTASAQTDTIPYGTVKNMPTFYEQLKRQLTYPMAWGNSPTKDFDRWRAEARNILTECMQNLTPAPQSYDMETVDTESRNGYKAHKIRFNVSAWCRIPAYLLVPDGEGPFPAIVVLHDHGAHFSIGKEKMIRPFHVAPETLADADDWAERCYDGRYVGDYFAAHGYAVLSIDALFWGERGRKEGVDYDGQQALASNFLQMGSSWGAFIHMDDVRSAEFLASLPFVDKERVGCLGFSMGGLSFMDAVRPHRLREGLRLDMLDEYHRQPDDAEQQPEQRRFGLRHAHPRPAPLSGLPPYRKHSLPQAHPLLQRNTRQAIPDGRSERRLCHHAVRMEEPACGKSSCHQNLG